MPTRDLRGRTFERILLIKPSAVGDVTHTLPVLVKLRARYPDARIDWLITPENADLVRHHPALSQAVLFPRRGFARDWASAVRPLKVLADLRRARYDLVVDLHGQFRSAVLTLTTGAATRIGFDRPRLRTSVSDPREPIPGAVLHGWRGAREGAWVAYTHRIPLPTLDVHAIDRYLWLGGLLGFDDAAPDFRVYLPPEAMSGAEQLIASRGLTDRPFALLVPGTIWETKHWHAEGFARVGRELQRDGLEVVLAGTARDRERCQAIVADCPGAIDLSGQTTLAGLIALIHRAAVCVTNDSGSMHLAVALDRPVVSVFGPTDPARIGPYGRPGAVVRADVPCAPCHLRSLRSCPHAHRCMTQVTGAEVADRARAVLAAYPDHAQEQNPSGRPLTDLMVVGG